MPPKKAKAAASLADMVDSEDDLDMMPRAGSDQENGLADMPKRGARPAAARGRPAKSVAKQSSAGKPKSSKISTTTKRAPLKEHQHGSQQDDIDELEDDGESHDVADAERSGQEEAEAPTKKQPGRKGRPPGKAKPIPAAKNALEKVKVIENDGEFEYTPTRGGQSKATTKTKWSSLGEDMEEDQAEPHLRADQDTGGQLVDDEEEARPNSRSKVGNITRTGSRPYASTTSAARWRANESDAERGGDVTLRRKVGEMTRKLETMETKYRNLREIGIVEAEANYDRLKKQMEQKSKAAADLIESLRAELETQRSIAQESRSQNSDLAEARKDAAKQRAAVAELEAAYASVQNDNRALQAKLSATRAASQDHPKVPSSAARGKAAIGHGGTPAAEDNAQLGQLKEDLYGDLTGLIIRTVDRQNDQDVYDCIQTGRNGTLHFKLSVVTNKEAPTSYEETEFSYEPRLDTNRDKDLIDIMPDYLCEDITFSRNNAARFYSRIADTLTKKIVD